MKNLFKKLHLPAVLALVGQVIGVSDLVASNPKAAELAVFPHLGLSPEWAAALVAFCTFLQAATRAIHSGDKLEVPKH
jgi:hypothetical protein